MDNEKKDIQIPIKGIVERAAKKHGCVLTFTICFIFASFLLPA